MKNLILTASSILFISGCASTPTTQISEFGDSTKAITERIDTVIEEYNNTALDRQFTSYASTYKLGKAREFSSDELAKIEKPISVKQKKNLAIYRANKALGGYASSLSLLASAGTRADIDLAAANLYGSIVSINDQYKTIKETDKDLFDNENLAQTSKIIAAIGNVIVEENSKLTRGETIVDWLGVTKRKPNCMVMNHADDKKFFELVNTNFTSVCLFINHFLPILQAELSLLGLLMLVGTGD